MEKAWKIDDIQALTEPEAAALALEALTIKEHTVYLVDFGGYFGYSALVFFGGRHIYYANDYALHHNFTKYNDDGTREQIKPGPAELRERYIEKMENILFTDEEITGPLKNYNEYRRKREFLHNYYGMREDHVSIFGIFRTEAEKEEHRRKTAGMILNPVAFADYPADKRDFVEHHKELLLALEQRAVEMEESYEYLKSAFKYEMHNHEYGINWQGDWDVLSCFGEVNYRDENGLTGYFDQLGFNDTQRHAYLDAQKEYFKEANY